jgi:hypothetical protein
MRNIFLPAKQTNGAALQQWFDGVRGIEWVDASGNPINMIIAGWTDANGFNQHEPQVYTTNDYGATITRLADRPYVGRHNNFFFPNRIDNRPYDCFGDGTDDSYPQDVNRFDWVNGWVTLTTNAGIGQRQGYFCATDWEYAIVGSGYTTIDNYIRSIYRTTLKKLAAGNGVFDYIGDVPDTMYPNGDGRLVCHKGLLFHYGGGQRFATTPYTLNPYIHQSKNSGKTLEIVGQLPDNFGKLWCDFVSTGTEVIGVGGSYAYNGLYPTNIIIAEDGKNFRYLAKNVPKRHASLIMQFAQSVVLGMGYQQNNLHKIEKISSNYNIITAP